MNRLKECTAWGRVEVGRRSCGIVLTLALFAAPGLANDYPTIERGFKPERAFQAGEIDNIRLLNGGLELTIPLGIRYPVGGAGLSYGFTLHYTSQLWDHAQNTAPPFPTTEAYPGHGFTAGFGWRLSLGEYRSLNSAPGIGLCQNCYIAPDGSQHQFDDKLHFDVPGQPGVWFTTDGTFLRLQQEDSNWTIEFPSGEIHVFDSQGRLVEMRDQFTGRVFVAYPPDNTWLITDSEGRSHTVETAEVEHYERAVSALRLSAFGGSNEAIFSFVYETPDVPRSCLDDQDDTSATMPLPLLTSVALPDGSSYAMPLSSYYLVQESCPGGSPKQGLLRKVTLPTLGSVEWEYETYHFPVPLEAIDLPDNPPTWLSGVTGVVTRRLRNAANVVEGTWSYDQTLEFGSESEESVTSVTSPLGDRTDYYFNVGKDQNAIYGLSFSPLESAASVGRPDLFRSSKVYDLNPANGQQELERTTYLKYRTDALFPGSSPEMNPRVEATLTRFHDDSTRWAAEDYSSYDGLGHYRTATTSGSGFAALVRTSTTNFNPAAGEYPGSFTLPAAGEPWVLGDYDRIDTTESSVTARSEFCFDEYGFLKRARTLRNGTSRDATDLLAVFTPSAAGHRAEERYYGGDVPGGVSTGSICSLSPPAAAVYQIRNEISEGVLSSSRYYDGTNALPFYSLKRDIDPRTGLVSRSYDVADLGTSYEYDLLGRLTWVMPDLVAGPGGDGWTQYVYTRATSPSALAKLKINRRNNDGTQTAAIMAESELEFDSFGRLIEESRRMPGTNVWSSRETKYNALGLRASVSEWGNLAKKTTFNDYDAFGRPASITPPDGVPHQVSFSYAGVREVARTTKVATAVGEFDVIVESPSTTTETYDRQGRLISVKEPSGSGGALVTTTYSYDVGNRLKQVQTAAGVTQTRLFNYDNRGFLNSEQHPEKGLLGNGTVTYSGYDARGHATRKIDGPNDLTFVFDKAERLTLVRETGGEARTLKSFAYSGADDASLGKLLSAERYNYVFIPGAATGRVKETYSYLGRGGRVSGRTTELFVNAQPIPSETWAQGFEYTPLGEIDLVDYPRCAAGNCAAAAGAREVVYKFARGWLDEVEHPSGANWAEVDYHQNGTVSAVGHANGVTLLQGLDSNFMARPARISTSGVAGGMNWQTGDYVYDGSGNVVRIGDSLFLYDPVSRVARANVVFTPAGFAPPVGPLSPELGGLEHLFSDGFESGNTQAWIVPPGPTNGVQTFTYDAFGNLTDIVGDPAPPIGIDAQTNRVSGSSYDAAGNQLSWLVPEGGANSYSYGPFNEVWRVVTPAEEWVHVYTADDERLMSWQVGGEQVNRWTLRGLDNRVLREYRHSRTGAPSFIERDNIYRGSGPLLAAATPSGDRHYHVDHLGTPRQITDSTGAQVAFHTYWPYGEEATLPNQDTVRYKFTGHERDFGNPATPSDDHDHMHARMSNPRLGRFLSVDLAQGRPSRPQTWNRYSYVSGNPLRRVDPDGLDGLEFSDYASATWSAVGSTADRVGYLVAQPLLVVGAGILNDDPVQFATGLVLTGSRALGATAFVGSSATGALGGAALTSGVIGGTATSMTSPGDKVESFVTGFSLSLASPPLGGGVLLAAGKGALASSAAQVALEGSVSTERTLAAGLAGATGVGVVRLAEAAGAPASPVLRTIAQRAAGAAWAVVPTGGSQPDSNNKCSEMVNGVARCE